LWLEFVFAFLPQDLGWPACRRRLFVTAVKKETLLWFGPSQPSEIRSAFLKMFGARVILEGDIFWGLDSGAHRAAFMRHLCATRGVWPLAGASLKLVDVLSPGARDYIKGYKNLLKNGKRKIGALHGSYIVDLSQNPAKRARSGAWLPTAARSSKFALLVRGGQEVEPSILTPNELNFSQGWPSLDVGCKLDFAKDMSYDLGALPPRQQQSLTGNGIHLASFAAWVFFIKTQCVRRDQHEGLPASIASSSSAAAAVPAEKEAEAFSFEAEQ
jgi:hypothetical protein